MCVDSSILKFWFRSYIENVPPNHGANIYMETYISDNSFFVRPARTTWANNIPSQLSEVSCLLLISDDTLNHCYSDLLTSAHINCLRYPSAYYSINFIISPFSALVVSCNDTNQAITTIQTNKSINLLICSLNYTTLPVSHAIAEAQLQFPSRIIPSIGLIDVHINLLLTLFHIYINSTIFYV